MRKIIYWDRAKCKNCKTEFDLPTLRERKDYKPGICPLCFGKLETIKGYERRSKNEFRRAFSG